MAKKRDFWAIHKHKKEALFKKKNLHEYILYAMF